MLKKVRCNAQQYFHFQKHNQVQNYGSKVSSVLFHYVLHTYVLGAVKIRVFQASFEIMKISPSLSHVATNCRPNFAVFSSPSSRKNKLYHMWYLSFKRRLLNSVSWVVEFQSWMHKCFSSK